MNMGEFLYTVTEQIRCKKAREPVGEELKDHILDQAHDYQEEGMEKEEALEKAVREMGDPVEIGVALDRVHRPATSWSMLILIGVISLFSIALHGAMEPFCRESGMGGYYFKTQIFYVVLGFLLMLGVYRLDYSFLAKRSRYIAAAMLLFLIAGSLLLGEKAHGAYRFIRLFGVRISTSGSILLYVPVYGALLYDYRGQGYRVLWKLFLWAAVPVGFAFGIIPSLHTASILILCFAVLFTVAVMKNWYTVSRKVFIPLWGLIIGCPACVLLIAGLDMKGVKTGFLAPYQFHRLQVWLGGQDAAGANYVVVRAREILQASSLIGGNEENLNRAVNEFPGFNSDYILVSLMAVYGILAGVLAVALLIWMVGKIFHISFGQKNQLGMIVGCGCGTVFLTQILQAVAMNVNLLPPTSAVLPFFCFGGSSTVISYILLGLALSVYRYKNVLVEKPLGKAAQEKTMQKQIIQGEPG